MRFTYFVVLLSLLVTPVVLPAEVRVDYLKTEYTGEPLGIDVEKPRFSWQMLADDARGYFQTACQIIVTDESGKEVWHTGKVKQASSLNIRYEGEPLQPATRYDWHLTVWDQNDKSYTEKSWFETGLMNPDAGLSGWNGARWIGGGDEDLVLYAPYLPVFKIHFSIQLDKKSKSTSAGFVYGANDPRLTDKNKNLYGLENSKDNSWLSVTLDIAPLNAGEQAQVHIYRAGYHPDDKKDVPFKSFPIPETLLNAKNQYSAHRFYISSVLGYTHIHLNGTEDENKIGEINLNPLGRGGDFIAFPVAGEIGFSVSPGQSAVFSGLEIRNYRDPSNILFTENLNKNKSIFSNRHKSLSIKKAAYHVDGKKAGVLVTADPSVNSMPMVRTTFSTSSPEIKKARLYVTARGIYELFLNGERVGNDMFNPGLTQYNKTHLYQTYDVTAQLQPGKNALGALLGEGWWSGGATYMGEFWNFFGDRQSLLAKLVITYTNGKEDVIVTHPDHWKYFNDGPLVYGSFFQGEVYDATKESAIVGWDTPGYDDSGWKKAVEIPLKGTISNDESNKWANMPVVNDYNNMSLTGQYGPTVKLITDGPAAAVEEVRPGVYVYDMGQNLAGVPKISLSGMEPGRKINIRFAEVKYPDLPEYKDHTGMIMLENIRAAMAQDIYITKGGEETIRPRFTFHGYRYIEITGIEEALPLSAVQSEGMSSVHNLSSAYVTSNPEVNKLWTNIVWSSLANFISIPTDCPQRNERLGWSGDISVFSRTATFLLEGMPQFLRRHLTAMRDVQREDGRFPDIAPLGGGFGGILWGSAGITIAWECYQQFADTDMLAEHYGSMKDYIEFLFRHIDPETGIFSEGKPTDWGYLADWLSPEDNKNDKSLLWECYLIYDLELMSKMATVLGNTEDAEEFNRLYEERKEFFNKTYIDRGTGKTIHSAFIESNQGKEVNTQVSYVLPLAFGIVDKELQEKVKSNFLSTIKSDEITNKYPPYSLLTGFIGTAWISKALSDYGYNHEAYRLLQQTTYPSWLYSVEQGATTIWERLNSYTHTDGFGGNNRMNSFNHYSFGAVGSWMYNYSLGIDRDEDNPGFRHFILHPEIDRPGEMSFAKGYYESMYGRIESGWEKEGNSCTYSFAIPANTSATLYLKASYPGNIRENGRFLGASPGVKYTGIVNGKHVFVLPSGRYIIQVQD